MSNQEKLQNGSSPHSAQEIQEAEDNLTRCLEAFDQRGEEGFNDEWERINPNPALAAVGLLRIRTPLGHALVTDRDFLPTRKATSSEME